MVSTMPITISLILNGMSLFIIIALLLTIKSLKTQIVDYDRRFVLISYEQRHYSDKTIIKYTDKTKPGIQELVIREIWDRNMCNTHFESMNKYYSENQT